MTLREQIDIIKALERDRDSWRRTAEKLEAENAKLRKVAEAFPSIITELGNRIVADDCYSQEKKDFELGILLKLERALAEVGK